MGIALPRLLRFKSLAVREMDLWQYFLVQPINTKDFGPFKPLASPIAYFVIYPYHPPAERLLLFAMQAVWANLGS
jgi:hypothetical protein